MGTRRESYKVIARDHATMFFHLAAYIEATATTSRRIIGMPDTSLAVITENGFWKYSAQMRKALAATRHTLKKLEGASFFRRVYDQQKKSCAAVVRQTRQIRDARISQWSDRQLVAAYRRIYRLWVEMNAWGQVPNLADFEHFLLTEKIMGFLRERSSGKSISPAEAFGVLVAPVERSPLARYEGDLYTVLGRIQADTAARNMFRRHATADIDIRLRSFPVLQRTVNQLVRRYDWMQYHYNGPTILSRSYFIELLASEIRQGVDARVKAAAQAAHIPQTKAEQRRIAALLGLTDHERYWVRVARTFAYLKALRKDTVFIGSRNSEQLFSELGRRLHISRTQARYLSPDEAERWLRRGRADVDLVNDRYRLSVIYADEKKLHIITGAPAKKMSKLFYKEQAPKHVKELTGTSAYPGRVRGRVKIIIHADDMQRMNRGDILISPATNPNVVPAMKIAGAIVTDEGGVTCHAAIVSRELRKPCVIGTRVATKVFTDGDRVEVDAQRGIVRKLPDQSVTVPQRHVKFSTHPKRGARATKGRVRKI